ncbi:GGDEF domain-containing protein [Acidaminobacter sp. JC074]|uniref:GGDEF domain-containing protein n=1 Tax=Acidaminobacter sp. JC074 TaxID=2530199 RepID=UPI001F0F4355|nr:GGDEF domain-containing protein [Acidaminobacter sp. JC074]MCH4889786.1 GGDEF domain-containing protein [Acidaminobacter sp. JC074]
MNDYLIMVLLISTYIISGYINISWLLPITLLASFFMISRDKVYTMILILSIICLSFMKPTWLVYPLVFMIMYGLITKDRRKLVEIEEEVRIRRDMDSLSGLYNNRYVVDYLENRLKHVNGDPLAVLLMDVDGFRRINEKFGHAYGDLLISEIAKLLKGISDSTDILGRYGGEEFILVLNNGTLERSITIADEIKQGIEEMPIKDEMKITMSIGIAFNDNDTAAGLIKKADLQLVQAKKLGKGDLN